MNILNHNTPIIIGIDRGCGNIKTAHHCFKTGVASYGKEPAFKADLLICNGRYYIIGEEHKEFVAGQREEWKRLRRTEKRQGLKRETSARQQER